MSKGKLILRIVAGVVVAGLVTGGVVYATNQGTGYRVCTVEEKSISGTVEESGKIHGKEDKVYYAVVTAPVKGISVKEGDAVDRGELILEYDTSDLERGLREASLKAEQTELDINGKISESDKYASKYKKALNDDMSYAQLYYIYREQNNGITEEQYARSYQIQCQIDSLTRDIADKEKEIAEEEHKKNKAAGYGTKDESDYTEKNVKDIKEAQKEIDRLNQELIEMNKGLAVESNAKMTPDENERLNDNNNVLEDITRNWTEAKSNKAAYEGNILNGDEKEALEKNKELTKEEEEAAAEELAKAQGGVKSEFSGIITSLNVHDGAFVNEGTPLFTVETSEDLVCRVNVSKYDILDIKEGQKAVIDIAGRSYEGTVSKTGKLATEDASDKNRVEVEIALSDADEAAIIGLEGDVTIYTEEKGKAAVIPIEALYSDDDGDYCYVIKDGKVEKARIKTGIKDSLSAEVTEGLQAEDIVITDSVTDADIGKKAKNVSD